MIGRDISEMKSAEKMKKVVTVLLFGFDLIESAVLEVLNGKVRSKLRLVIATDRFLPVEKLINPSEDNVCPFTR